MKKFILILTTITVTIFSSSSFVYASQLGFSNSNDSAENIELTLVNDPHCEGDNEWTDYCLEGNASLNKIEPSSN